MNGDKYLATKTAPGDDTLYAGLSLADTGAATLIKDMGPGGASSIGAVPEKSTLINNGDTSVNHGTVVFDPSS